MEGIVDEKEKTPCGRFRFVVGLVSLLSLSTFVILAAIRISADSRGTSIGGIVLDWIKILIPFYIFAVTLFVYGLANYILSAPNIGMSGGHGGQFYYNLLGQLLVRDLGYKSLENFNEGAVLRGLLRGVVYTLIIAYSAMASALECKNCDVPYKMLSVGFLVTYFFRLIMLLYNGFYSYHRLLAMTEEVRSYQESLDQTRLFDHAIPYLYATGQKSYSMFFDLFLWILSITFAIMGSVWVSNGSCDSACPATFHIYEYLLIVVYTAEAATLLSRLYMKYHARVNHIEAFDTLITKIEEHNNKMELKAK